MLRIHGPSIKYIPVNMNCFAPLSHITTVYRGANAEHGIFIGDFEMGIIQAASRICIGTNLVQMISNVLLEEGNRTSVRQDEITKILLMPPI
ncbi:hypothetical protein BDN70DRAFT_297196 [Pholiota conissans]|uniref:Uncharacterized protein n=1 Tax=Pholiota conissans TaxID=109636 RepID=A0A9P6CQ77_9AGAR|nr:hypothetical protein BDN70DRAFT_297196 [Pholiota conissans]